MAKPEEKTILYPEFLDGLGTAFARERKQLALDSLKPATVGDVLKILDAVMLLQQSDVLAYNLMVKNYNHFSQRLADIEGKVRQLEETYVQNKKG